MRCGSTPQPSWRSVPHRGRAEPGFRCLGRKDALDARGWSVGNGCDLDWMRDQRRQDFPLAIRPAGAIDRVRTADGPTIETAMAAAGFAALRYEHVGAFGSVAGWCIGQVMASPCEHVHSNPASRSSGNVKRSAVGTAIRMDNCSTIHPPARRRSRRRIFCINRQTTTVVLGLYSHICHRPDDHVSLPSDLSRSQTRRTGGSFHVVLETKPVRY